MRASDLFLILTLPESSLSHPVLLDVSPGARDVKGVRFNVLSDCGTCSYIAPLTHVNRGYYIGIASDKGVILDGGAMLVGSIIVNKDHSASQVDASSSVTYFLL